MSAERKGAKLPPRERRRNPVGIDPQRDARALRADVRAAERAKRSAEQQLVALDFRPGKSTRERTRLVKIRIGPSTAVGQ